MIPIITYYSNGNIECEYYKNDLNEYHNESGPAIISYYENGNKKGETYCINGDLHNLKGPTYIAYSENGIITFKFYWLNGIKINVKTDEEFEKYIKRLNIS